MKFVECFFVLTLYERGWNMRVQSHIKKVTKMKSYGAIWITYFTI